MDKNLLVNIVEGQIQDAIFPAAKRIGYDNINVKELKFEVI